MNVCRTFKNARENNRGGKLVMFSLKPRTYIIIHATDTMKKNENILYNIENGKKSRASRSRHPQRFISCVSAAMVRRRWSGDDDGYAGRSRLRCYKPFIITTRYMYMITILCTRTCRRVFYPYYYYCLLPLSRSLRPSDGPKKQQTAIFRVRM